MIIGSHEDNRVTVLRSLLCQQCCSCCPHRKSFVVHHFLLHRGCPVLWTRSQFKEDRGTPPACTSRIVWSSPTSLLTWLKLKVVHWFIYMGCTIISDAKINKQVDKLAKVSRVFGWLYEHVWYNRHLKKGITINMYRVIDLATLLYGSVMVHLWAPFRTPWTIPPALPLHHP